MDSEKARGFVLMIVLLAGAVSVSAQKKISEAFRIKEKDLIPEGIAFDPHDKVFYVGSIHKQKIVKVTAKGTVSDFAVSVGQVLGMKVDGAQRRLWVCSNSPAHDTLNFVSRVYVFSLRDGALEKKYEVSGKKKHLFNDIVITSGGDAYVTDSDGGGIYVIRKSKDSIDEYVRQGELRYPNGIVLSPDEKKLIVACSNGSGLASIDLATKKIESLAHEKYLLIGIDGLYRAGNQLIGIQNVTFPESILVLTCDDDFTRVLTVRALASDLPQFNIPTTGALAEGNLYFIANSQINQISETGGTIRKPEALEDIIIMKVEIPQ